MYSITHSYRIEGAVNKVTYFFKYLSLRTTGNTSHFILNWPKITQVDKSIFFAEGVAPTSTRLGCVHVKGGLTDISIVKTFVKNGQIILKK